MPTDVIIDPSTGQIYWNDSAVSAQSISIKGDAQNTISIVGYSGAFSPGSSPGGATTLATFTDNSGTDAFIPGTNGYDLGKDTARWRLWATSGVFSGDVNVASTTQSTSLLSGAIKVQGGLAVSSNASIGQTLFFFNPSNAFFTAFRAGAAAASTTYTLPTNSPQSSAGTSVLSSTIAGVMTWVPLASSGSGAAEVYTGALYDVAYFATAGATVQGSSTLINNTATGQVRISHTTASFGTSSGALQVAGGVGISGRLSFNQASFGTTGITTVPTMAMIGQTGDPIFLSVLEDNSVVFEGSQGQLFSISPNLSTGYIWAVNDISGIPLIRANASGNVFINEFGGLVGLGNTNPAYKFHVRGSSAFATTNGASAISFLFDNISAPGSNSFQVKSANSIQLYNSADTFYTAIKSNASTNVTYTLPQSDGSNGQALTTNGSGTLSWTTITGGSGGGGTGVQPGGEFEIAYYAATGASVQGSSTFKNDTTAAKVSVTHTTASISSSTGALVVSGGVGIGGSLWVTGIGASISGVRLAHSIAYGNLVGNVTGNVSGNVTGNVQGNVTGNVSGTVTGNVQGNVTGNVSGTVTGNVQGNVTGNVSGNLTGNVTGLATTSNNIQVAIGAENLSHTLLFTRPTSTVSGSGGIAVSNDLTLFFNPSTEILSVSGLAVTSALNSISSTTGALNVVGGVGVGQSVSIRGSLQMFSASNYTAFVSGATANTTYTLPVNTPQSSAGTSVLSSTIAGVMSWVPLASSSGSGLATTANNIYVNILGNPNVFHPLLVTPAQLSAGSAVSANGTLLYNPSTDYLHTPGLAVTSGLDSSSTTTGALQVRGGIGVTGTGYFDIVRTRAIVTTGDVTIAGNLAVNGSTIDFGNAATDSISFIGRVDTDIDPIATNTYDLGADTLVWKNVSIGSSAIFYNTSNANTLGFRAGASGASLIYVFPIDTPSAGQVLAASAPSGGVVTLSWEDDQTGAPAGGITTLNTLTAASQSFATGTAGNDFGISSVTSTHTFNLPDASATARGVITTGAQTIAGAKTFTSTIVGTATSTLSTVVLSSSTATENFLTFVPASSAVGVGLSIVSTVKVTPSSGLVTASGFSGNVTGTVSGNVTGSISGNVTGNVSGTVTGNVQGNVTGNVSGTVTGNVQGNVTGNVSGNVTGNVVGIAITAGSTHVSVASAATAHAITVVPTTSAQVTVGIGQSIVSGVTVLASTGVITAGGFSGNVTGTVSGNVTGNLSGSVTGNVQGNVTGNVSGTVTGNVQGNVTGNVSGTVTGNVQGNVTGNVSGNLTGNVTGLATTSYNIQVAIGSENLSHTLLFTRPSSIVSGSGGIAVSQDLTLFFNPSTEILSVSGLAVTSPVNSITTTSGALIVTGGASVGQSLSIGGRLQLFNSSFSTAFVSAQAGVNTTYTLPTTSPAATGTSVLSSTMAGVMSWVPLTSTVGGSGTPGGSNKQIQYNNSSAFGGASGFEYTTGGIAVTVSVFSPSGTGYTSGLWVSAIGATTRIGIGLSNPAYELEILGEISATNKSFVIDHPTKSGMKLRYGSLEGPENGVYVRGELNNSNIIEVPDHWLGLVHPDSYTVHLTPIGRYAQLYVQKIENYNVFIADSNMNPIHCYYSVWAERKDIPKLVTEYEAK